VVFFPSTDLLHPSSCSASSFEHILYCKMLFCIVIPLRNILLINIMRNLFVRFDVDNVPLLETGNIVGLLPTNSFCLFCANVKEVHVIISLVNNFSHGVSTALQSQDVTVYCVCVCRVLPIKATGERENYIMRSFIICTLLLVPVIIREIARSR
jgi:hypothetical protein